MVLPPIWQVTPLGVLALVVAVVNEVGLRRLAKRQSPEHRRSTRKRSWALYAGLALLVVFVTGPFDRWAMKSLSVHMVLHVVEMFYLPPLMIIGAPFVPMLFALPVGLRRRLMRTYYLSRSLGWARFLVRAAENPIVAVAFFNVVMVTWHIPVVFDWMSWNNWVMNWLMAPSFVLSGMLFWRVTLSSHPHGPRGSLKVQAAGLVVTAFEMLVLAMAMAIFTKGPWYSMNVLMEGYAAATHDQHHAAAILWICSDLWAVPALALVSYRLVSLEGGAAGAFERALGRA